MDRDRPRHVTPPPARGLLAWGDALRVYHRHRVRGLDRVRAAVASGRPVLLAGNHCLDVTDPLMLMVALQRELGVIVPAIGHELLFFGLPGMRQLVRASSTIPSRHPDVAERMLREHGTLLVYPGAGQEAALRSYRREPYTLKWYARSGFVRLALRTKAVLLFVAGIGIDEMYYQTDWAIPPALFRVVRGTYWSEYQGARIQLGAAGIHVVPGLFPLPVRVTHVISGPLVLDEDCDPGNPEQLERVHIDVWAQCQRFLDDAVAARENESDWLDRTIRAGMRGLQSLGI